MQFRDKRSKLQSAAMRTLLLLCLLLLGQAAPGYAFPDQPFALIVPFPWTGSADITGVPRLNRLTRAMQTLSPSLTDYLVHEVQRSIAATLGQPVHVYRRVQGKINIGTSYVATAAPDGYTLLFADNPTITVAPVRNPGLRIDPAKALLPAPGTAEDFRALVEKDRARWAQLLKTVAVSP